MKKVLIVDYGCGNIASVVRSFGRQDCSVGYSSNPKDILSAERIILPGVGQFAVGMEELKRLNLLDALNEFVLIQKKPILGICLGMQLMTERSEEGDVDGLGWFEAETIKFRVEDKQRFKIPHIGWNTFDESREHPLLKGIDGDSFFYFVHSYHAKCRKSEDSLGITEYAYPFTSIIQKDNIMGVQFHPEKSYEAGDRMFENFLGM